MRTRRKKHSRLWAYLLYLGLVTSLILSVTLARYASTAGGTGTATVAALAGGVEDAAEAAPIELSLGDLSPGDTRVLKFKVVNYSGDKRSEVALDYTLTLESTNNLPLTFTLAAQAENQADLVTLPADGAVLGPDTLQTEGEKMGTRMETLSGGAFDLTGEDQEHTYTLTVTWPAGEYDGNYSQEIDLVTVKVKAIQRLQTGG